MRPQRIAIIGAGLSGATCARLLADAGCTVQVFDKSRGVGGRMATRRARRTDADPALFDHGVPAWTAASPAFESWLHEAEQAGVVGRWLGQWVGQPDMPAVCRWLLRGVPVQTECWVDGLSRHEASWMLNANGQRLDGLYDAVVVAIPPAQAAALWDRVQPDWARAARSELMPIMQPCWTLMGITDDLPYAADPPPIDLSDRRPGSPAPSAPWTPSTHLARLIRQDRKPQRQTEAGLARWVAHARADWSSANLEGDPQQVQNQLQAAVESILGVPLRWHHAVVHRWRYAIASPNLSASAGMNSNAHAAAGGMGLETCWWDPQQALGACGDAIGASLGLGGIEAAWHSGRSMAMAIRD